MPEKAVFWLGGKPGQAGAPKKGIEQEQEFAAAIGRRAKPTDFRFGNMWQPKGLSVAGSCS